MVDEVSIIEFLGLVLFLFVDIEIGAVEVEQAVRQLVARQRPHR